MPNEARKLSVEEIQEAAESFKEDMVRDLRRAARRHDQDSPYEAYASVKAEEAIDQFLYNLKMLACSELREYLQRPARARLINTTVIDKALRNKQVPPKIITRK